MEKGKDIAKIVSNLRDHKADKISLRPMSRSKFFDFENSKNKWWNLKEYTDPQGWSNFMTLQEHTYEDLVREFYNNLSIKEKKDANEKFLISSVKGVEIKVTQDFLSEALKIPNEGNKLFLSSWYNGVKVNRNQLIIKYTKENQTFNSTNLKDIPKILHNMVRHTLVPKCGSFHVVSVIDLCIIFHLMIKTKLNLCFIITQHMIESCLAIKQTVVGLPYGMHLTPLFQKANVPLEGEKRKLEFMKFTSKTLGQLRITTSNMPSFQASETSGSVKRLSDQNVQNSKKKRKAEKVGSLSQIQTEDGYKSHKDANVEAHSPPVVEIFSHVAKLTKEIIQEGSSQYEALLAGSTPEDDALMVNDASLPKEAENVEQLDNEVLFPNDEENSYVQKQRVKENTEQTAQKVDDDTREDEILVSNTLRSENQHVEIEHMEFSTGFNLNIEDLNSDFNNEVFHDGQDTIHHVQETTEFEAQNVEVAQTDAHNVPTIEDVPAVENVQNDGTVQDAENVQVLADQNVDQNASNEPLLSQDQLSTDPIPMDFRSLPSMEVQHMAQTVQNVNMSSSTMGPVAGASNFLISPLPTPNTIHSSTPPPPPIKTTNKLPKMSALFYSLNTFVTTNKEKAEASGVVPPAKPSRVEKLAYRALKVSTKTHKIACVLANWTVNVHAPGLAIPPPIFDDPTVFDSEPYSDYRDSTP